MPICLATFLQFPLRWQFTILFGREVIFEEDTLSRFEVTIFVDSFQVECLSVSRIGNITG